MIDAHCHLQLKEFDEIDPFALVEGRDVNGYIVADYDSKRRDRLYQLKQNYPAVWICAGIHPWALSKKINRNLKEWALFEEFLEQHYTEIVAIGECGLDAAMKHGASLETQWEWFEKQIECAKKYDLPVVLHIVRMYDEVIDFFKQDANRGVVGLCHGFSGTPEEAKQLSDMGFLISIGTDVLQGKGRTREVCKQLGIQRLAIETDSPSRCPKELTPPMRPHYLPFIAAELAKILELEVGLVSEITEQNTRKLFGI